MESNSSDANPVARILRRSLIQKEGSERTSASQISQLVREKEQAHHIPDILANFDSEIHLVDPTWYAIAQELQERLAGELRRQDLSVVLLGSGANGARTIRNFFDEIHGKGNPSSADGNYADFDWGLLSEAPLQEYERTTIHEESQHMVTALGVKHKVEGVLMSCYRANGKNITRTNLHSKEEAYQELIKPAGPSSLIIFNTNHLLFFYPSLPEKTNQQNQQYVLSALTQLSQDNPELWRERIQTMLDGWKKVHALIPKHFSGTRLHGTQDARLLDQVEPYSQDQLSKSFEALLATTAK